MISASTKRRKSMPRLLTNIVELDTNIQAAHEFSQITLGSGVGNKKAPHGRGQRGANNALGWGQEKAR